MTITAPIIPMPPSTDGEVVVRRKPGRPRKIRPAPTADQAEYERSVAQARERAMAEDALLGLLRTERPDPVTVLHMVTVATAEEQAALLWDRERVEERNGDAQRISSRRIEALGKMATLVLEQKKLGISGDADPRSPQYRRIEKLWLDTIADCARETLPSETGTIMLDKLMAAMSKWRETTDSTR
jgi:hypothetical protein